jgi:hypothetical protein
MILTVCAPFLVMSATPHLYSLAGPLVSRSIIASDLYKVVMNDVSQNLVNAQLVWSSGMTSLSHGDTIAVGYREDPGFDPQHEHCFLQSSGNSQVKSYISIY